MKKKVLNNKGPILPKVDKININPADNIKKKPVKDGVSIKRKEKQIGMKCC